MAMLITRLEQHLDRQPPTVVIQVTTWWETTLTHVKLQECGLGVHLPINVCMFLLPYICMHIHRGGQALICFSPYTVVSRKRLTHKRAPTPNFWPNSCIGSKFTPPPWSKLCMEFEKHSLKHYELCILGKKRRAILH